MPTFTPIADNMGPLISDVTLEKVDEIPCQSVTYHIEALIQDTNGISSVDFGFWGKLYREDEVLEVYDTQYSKMIQVEQIDPTGKNPSHGRYRMELKFPVITRQNNSYPTHVIFSWGFSAKDPFFNHQGILFEDMQPIRINFCVYID